LVIPGDVVADADSAEFLDIRLVSVTVDAAASKTLLFDPE
jgi:hypothetical protein